MFECIIKILWEKKIPRLLREIVRKISVLAFLNLSEICDEKMWEIFGYFMCGRHKAHGTENYPQ